MLLALSQRAVYGTLGMAGFAALTAVVVGASAIAAMCSPMVLVGGIVLGVLAPSFRD